MSLQLISSFGRHSAPTMSAKAMIVWVLAVVLVSEVMCGQHYDYSEYKDYTAPEKPVNLCDNVEITSADRTADNHFYVFRDNHYWELIGLPDPHPQVKGPFKVTDKWRKYMAPVTNKVSVSTVVSGPTDGRTYRFTQSFYWSWDKSYTQIGGGALGADFPGIAEGFNTVYNDGDLDKKGYPLFVAFKGVRVYYYRSKKDIPSVDGNKDGYIGGRNNESFPADLTASFPYPSLNPAVKYNLYLFRRDQYCYRPVVGEKDCKEWKQNADLFGCNAGGGKGSGGAKSGGSGGATRSDGAADGKTESANPSGGDAAKPDGDKPATDPKKNTGTNPSLSFALLLYFFVLYLILNV